MNSKLLKAVKMLLDCPALNCEGLEQYDLDAIEFARSVVKESDGDFKIHFSAFLGNELIGRFSARNEESKRSVIETLTRIYGSGLVIASEK